MTDDVVDSSIVAKWILPEADSALAQRHITDAAMKGHRLLALDLAIVEVANAIWKQHYRGLATWTEAQSFLDSLIQCPVHKESALQLLQPALAIAAKYKRTIYDALFVALAREIFLKSFYCAIGPK